MVQEIYETTSMDEAVNLSIHVARNDDTVLLSPACASFDLFENFEERGNKFKEAVKRL
jgi:UDP-N-acetylmuramoylalanine--D-glutamate ligase